MVGEALGMTIAQGAGNLLFGQFNQDLALKGQQKALKQQNDASMDIWNRTNYWAQRQQMERAGLNPALMYGMGSGSGGQTGNSSSNMDGNIASPNVGMALQNGMQMDLLKAQKENIEADTKNKLADATKKSGIDTQVGEALKLNYASLTKNNDAKTELTRIESDIKRIERDIIDVSQWYEMGIKLEQWRKLQGEAQSALARGQVDDVSIQNAIDQNVQDLAIKKVIERSYEQGIKLSQAQAHEAYAQAAAALKNADTNKLNYLVNEMNAGTNAANAKTAFDRLELDKQINDISKSTGVAVEIIKDIVMILAFRGVFSKGRTIIEGFKGAAKKLY